MKQKTVLGGLSPISDYSTIRNFIFLVALLLTAISVFVPFSPGMPWEDLDPSWVWGMNEALAKGLVFGKDIIFTYGPYASINTRIYHPATDQLMIFGALYLGFSFSLVAYLNFKQAGWQFQIALLIALTGAMYSRDALFFFYPLLVGVQAYHSESSSDANKSKGISETALLVALFAPLGLLPLIKGSILIACIAITVLSALFPLKKRQWRQCLLIGATPVISMLVFWTIAGQPPTALPDYFISIFPLISGYTEAMAYNGNSREFVFYALAGASLIVFMFRDTKGLLYEKSLVILMFASILFLTFKAGFVRHDGHAVISGTMIVMATILAGTLTTNRSALTIFAISLTAWLIIDANYIKTSSYSFLENIRNTYSSARHGIKQRISDPGKLKKDFDARVIELNTRGGIPKLNGTVDIYSYDQAHLIASGNEWNPRPILQSYSVYTPVLVEKNKAHLLGEHRPDNIIFKVQPIDERLPSLEDGESWPELLARYEPTSVAKGYLYLKHRNSDEAPIKFTTISRGTYSLGDQFELPKSDGFIFAKIHLKKSLAGIISNTLFKPSQLEIKLTMENGVVRSYRMIASMAESGFIISPLIENTNEFGFAFSGAKYLSNKIVKSIEIRAHKFQFLWKDTFEIEFSSVDYKPNPAFIDRVGVSQPSPGTFTKVTTTEKCEGSIDNINGTSPVSGLIDTSLLLSVSGWLAASVENADVPPNVYLVLENSEGKRLIFGSNRTPRPDVAAHFNKPSLNSCGYASLANTSSLKGNYDLSLAYSRGDELFLCPKIKAQIRIRQE